MDTKTFRVSEVASWAGVTVRTLHHYDELGLLVPSERSRSGHRLYCQSDLLRLQQILLYREMGLALQEIANILSDPAFDAKAALVEQREHLKRRVHTTEAMLRSIDRALEKMEGEPMNSEEAKELFDGFDPVEHEAEVKQRWGNSDAYRESAKRTAKYSKTDWAEMKAEQDRILAELAKRMSTGVEPTSEASMDLADAHRLHIDRWFYPCSHPMHLGLSQMYEADPRFKETFEKVAEGLAAYLVQAIEANAARATNG